MRFFRAFKERGLVGQRYRASTHPVSRATGGQSSIQRILSRVGAQA